MWRRGRRDSGQIHTDVAEHASLMSGNGGALATVISLFALLFSGYSFYESVLRAPQLSIYVPPQIQYTDPDKPDSPFEVFILPITVANDGARAGTVLSLSLEVTNPRTSKTKMFYSAQLGSWGRQTPQAFTPVSLSGKASYSDAIQFFPRVGEDVPRILDLEAGKYEFRLTLEMASAGSGASFFRPRVQPLEFEMQIGQLDYRLFSGTGTIGMWSPGYRSAASNPL